MGVYIDQSQWDEYAQIQLDFWDDNATDILRWSKSLGTIPRYGEDQKKNLTTMDLKCMFQFNNFRTWPVNIMSDTGEEDKQSQVAILSIDYLKSLDLLDDELKFKYDVTQDKFYHRGYEYESSGDTFVAQAGNRPIFFYIILKRYDAQAIQKN